MVLYFVLLLDFVLSRFIPFVIQLLCESAFPKGSVKYRTVHEQSKLTKVLVASVIV